MFFIREKVLIWNVVEGYSIFLDIDDFYFFIVVFCLICCYKLFFFDDKYCRYFFIVYGIGCEILYYNIFKILFYYRVMLFLDWFRRIEEELVVFIL